MILVYSDDKKILSTKIIIKASLKDIVKDISKTTKELSRKSDLRLI